MVLDTKDPEVEMKLRSVWSDLIDSNFEHSENTGVKAIPLDGELTGGVESQIYEVMALNLGSLCVLPYFKGGHLPSRFNVESECILTEPVATRVARS